MATTLSELLGDRLGDFIDENNLEEGEIYTFTPAGYVNTENFCWIAPASGTAFIEIWGASGSGATQCCCGPGIPGNPGSYASKTVTMDAGRYICGFTGQSCCNADSLCFRGCSEATCIQICHNGGCSCLCAEGGAGGVSFCSTSTSPFCCYRNCGMCATLTSQYCGIICNSIFSHGVARHGGVGSADCLVNSRFSCTDFRTCNPCCERRHIHYVSVAPRIISKEGTQLMIQPGDCSTNDMSVSAPPRLSMIWQALNAGSMNANTGGHAYACWGGNRECQCYQSWGVYPMLPYGVPGIGGNSCDNSRDHGMRGGHGAVRIRFIRD